MLTDTAAAFKQYNQRIEAALFLIATPFLLFPASFLPGTLLALMLIAAIWLAPLLFARKPLPPTTPLHLVLILFCVMLIISTLVTADPALTLPKITNILLGLTLWRMLILWNKQRPFLPRATFLFIMIGSGFTLIGILNADWVAKAPSQIDLLQNIVTQRSWQVFALAGAESGIHPNQVAGVIMLYLPLLFSLGIGWLWQRPDRRWLWLCLTAVILITAIALLFTQSRSGWLGFSAGLFALLLLWAIILSPSRLRTTLWITLSVAFLIGLITIAQVGSEGFQLFWNEPQQETIIGSTTTISYRQAIWPTALQAIGDFAFTGTGLGSFRQVARRLYPISISTDFDIAHAHNVFFQVALDMGIPGLIAYLALLLIAVTLCWQAARCNMELRPYALGFLAGLIAFHIYGLTDTIALGAKPGLLFWWLLGLITTLPQILQLSDKSTIQP